MEDGSVFKLGTTFIDRVRAAVYARGLAHIITYRLCRPRLRDNSEIYAGSTILYPAYIEDEDGTASVGPRAAEALEEANTISYDWIRA